MRDDLVPSKNLLVEICVGSEIVPFKEIAVVGGLEPLDINADVFQKILNNFVCGLRFDQCL